jgi:nitrogen fixation NifU-like protein
VSLYPPEIVAHDRAPHREGALPGATHAATLDNPLCGDTVTIAFVAGETITDARFVAKGCALCRAAASMLCDRAAGSTRADLRALVDAFEAFVMGPPDAAAPETLGELAAFAGVRAVKSRRGCATLPFRAALGSGLWTG